MTEKHFGPEIVESQIGGQVVRDRKAATALVVGTFPVDQVHTDPAVRAAYIDKPITIRRRADVAGHFGEHQDGYTIARALDAIFDQDQGKGVGTIHVVNVYDPAKHPNGPGDVTNLDILGAFDAVGNATGLKHAYTFFQLYGYFPKFVIAPGFSLMTGVREELEVINSKIRARSYVDAPAGVSVQDAVEARGVLGDFDMATSSRRVIPCFPHMEAADTANAGQTMVEPYSPTLVGVHLSTIVELGYHHSPSNRAIRGRHPAQPILYTPGMSDDDVQVLRGAGYVTAEQQWGEGPVTSGNRSAAYPTDTDIRNFIHVQLIVDMVDEAILFFLDQHKDRNASPAKLGYVEGIINDWGKAKTVGTDPVLLGFRFRFDRQKTTVQSYADGQIFWLCDLMPVGIMETLTVERAIDITLARDALGLAA